jgi:hypothetical protein
MIEVSLLALMRAWVVTVVASAALWMAVVIEPIWNWSVYWRELPQAFEVTSDEGPPPIPAMTPDRAPSADEITSPFLYPIR